MGIKELIILTNENGRFATKFLGNIAKHDGVNLDVEELKHLFEQNGFHCVISTFASLEKDRDYSGVYIVYASSEDPGKFYKGFIEDIILNLEQSHAIVIPSYEYLHAHANKVYQELKRMRFKDDTLKKPSSMVFGSFSEVKNRINDMTFPCVVKVATGSGSIGVQLVNNRSEMLTYCKKLMKIQYFDYTQTGLIRVKLYVWRIIKKLIKHKHAQPISANMYTNKIVVQQFVPGLDGDYKVLYFYGRYYVLHRKNRANDFRASGSGLFDFPSNLNEIKEVLTLARRTVKEIRQPLISMDIVSNSKGDCQLIEFQCVYFGPLTMQYSKYYYIYNREWQCFPNTNTLEEEYCRAISEYISAHFN